MYSIEDMISRRTIAIMASCALSIAVPISYTRGRFLEGRRYEPRRYPSENSLLNYTPLVFIATLVEGEPKMLRVVAWLGVILIGGSATSIAFDFAPQPEIRATDEKFPETSGSESEASN